MYLFQVSAIKQTLDRDRLAIEKLLQLSRDNPYVMRAVHRKLEEMAKKEGNKAVLQGPCSIHPAHTAFRKGLDTLADSVGLDIVSLLRKLHSWFKVSTARREDMTGIFSMFEEIDSFFLRFVDSRWLSIGPALERFLEHEKSTTDYFLKFIPNSTDESNKRAMKSESYQDIVKFLKPGNLAKTIACAKFALFMSKLNTPFLILLQHQKPMIHKLYELCCQLVIKFMALVVKPERVPSDGRQLVSLSLSDPENLLPIGSCNFGEGMKRVMSKESKSDQDMLNKACRKAVISTIEYLQKSLPLERKLYANLRYLSPDLRLDKTMKTALVQAAKTTRRFDEEEIDKLETELTNFQLIDASQLPSFDDQTDRLDVWYRQVFDILKNATNEDPASLKKFVKITLPLAHGNAFLERGFNATKQITTGRESLNLKTLKGLKTCKGVVESSGGADKVTISSKTLNAVKTSYLEYSKEKQREKVEKRKKEEEERGEAEMRQKRRKKEEEEKAWRKRVAEIEEDIRKKHVLIKMQEDIQEESIKRAMEAKDKATQKANLENANMAREAIKKNTSLVFELQEKLKCVLSKKPIGN